MRWKFLLIPILMMSLIGICYGNDVNVTFIPEKEKVMLGETFNVTVQIQSSFNVSRIKIENLDYEISIFELIDIYLIDNNASLIDEDDGTIKIDWDSNYPNETFNVTNISFKAKNVTNKEYICANIKIYGAQQNQYSEKSGSTMVKVIAPDLNITNIIIINNSNETTNKILYNTPYSINVTILNNGTDSDANITENFTVKLIISYPNGTIIQEVSQNVSGLNAENSTNITFTWTPNIVGDVTITAKVDANNTIMEINESNNNMSRTFTVIAPNLKITDISLNETPVYYRIGNQINVTITNDGTANLTDAIDGNFTVILQVLNSTNNVTYESNISVNASRLNASNSTTVTFNWIPNSTGIFTLRAIINISDTGRIYEFTGEYNESITVVEKQINITVVSSQREVNLTNEFNVSINITGVDSRRPVGGIVYTLTYDPSILNCTNVTNMTRANWSINNSNGTITFNITGVINNSTTIVNITFKAIRNGTSTINITDVTVRDNESYLFSNVSTEVATVRVRGANLIVENITYESPVYQNVNTIISVTIKNSGDLNITTNFIVKLYINGTEIDSENVSGLNASDSRTINFSWTPNSTGNFTLRAVVDEENRITETNEDDNNKSINITVKDEKEIDIVIYTSKHTAYLGDTFTVNITLKDVDEKRPIEEVYCKLTYDPKIITCVKIDETLTDVNCINNYEKGEVIINLSSGNINTNVTVAKIVFKTLINGSSSIELKDINIKDTNGNTFNKVNITNVTITVEPKIKLKKGWNAISIPYKARITFSNDSSISSILTYYNNTWHYNIEDIKPLYGYYIYCNSTNGTDMIIEYIKPERPEPLIRYVFKGWNLIGINPGQDDIGGVKLEDFVFPVNDTWISIICSNKDIYTKSLYSKKDDISEVRLFPYEVYWMYYKETDMLPGRGLN